ncbi:hypothetical protein ACWGTO_29605 [Mesorhizobium sp. PL10]
MFSYGPPVAATPRIPDEFDPLTTFPNAGMEPDLASNRPQAALPPMPVFHLVRNLHRKKKAAALRDEHGRSAVPEADQKCRPPTPIARASSIRWKQ